MIPKKLRNLKNEVVVAMLLKMLPPPSSSHNAQRRRLQLHIIVRQPRDLHQLLPIPIPDAHAFTLPRHARANELHLAPARHAHTHPRSLLHAAQVAPQLRLLQGAPGSSDAARISAATCTLALTPQVPDTSLPPQPRLLLSDIRLHLEMKSCRHAPCRSPAVHNDSGSCAWGVWRLRCVEQRLGRLDLTFFVSSRGHLPRPSGRRGARRRRCEDGAARCTWLARLN
jgi:hypothetical protein